MIDVADRSEANPFADFFEQAYENKWTDGPPCALEHISVISSMPTETMGHRRSPAGCGC